MFPSQVEEGKGKWRGGGGTLTKLHKPPLLVHREDQALKNRTQVYDSRFF